MFPDKARSRYVRDVAPGGFVVFGFQVSDRLPLPLPLPLIGLTQVSSVGAALHRWTTTTTGPTFVRLSETERRQAGRPVVR